MEGPTPVSALIHAATMVTAGVYLVTRSNYIYDHTEAALNAVMIVGLVTLVWGAIIGCAKDDIKKGLAGSTMSQIGYMMLAAGLGPAGYAFAIFHLLTHGFFKANLFLGAGSVMHAMNDEVDMRRYGGLAKMLPITFVTFACGYLAIIGFPGFAGFFSKDKIIETAFGHDIWVGLIALIGAGITAFYMTRMMIMTYISEKRWAKDAHPHESPLVMTIPADGARGAVGDRWSAAAQRLDRRLARARLRTGAARGPADPGAGDLRTRAGGRRDRRGDRLVQLRHQGDPAVAPQRVSVATKAARADLYGDAFNEAVFMRPGQYLTRSLVYFDNRGVDGAVNGLAALVGGTSGRIRRWQTGFVRSYALSMLAGAALIVMALLAVKLA